MTDDRDHARCGIQLFRFDRDWRVGRNDVRRVLDAKLCNECAIGGQDVNRLRRLDADDRALDDRDVGASSTSGESV